jgi:hypothetical protein
VLAPAANIVSVRRTLAARHVRPGDVVEFPDSVTGRPVQYPVADVVAGWVWIGATRIDTVLVVTDPESGRGPVLGADDPVSVVDEFPDQPEPDAPADPHPGEVSWW